MGNNNFSFGLNQENSITKQVELLSFVSLTFGRMLVENYHCTIPKDELM